MKRTIILILSAVFMLSAAFVPVDRAKTVAENQYKHYCADVSSKGANIVNVIENKYEGEATWYAFEFDKGFVIVSADDAVRPILGYSDHGKVPKADRPGGQNFKEWFGNYDKQIAYMRKNNKVDMSGQKSWKEIEANVFSSSKAGIIVDRLVKSEWDQVWPWNDQCPLDAGEASYVGCVATAMAQVLRYHKWPDVGTGSHGGIDFTTHTWNYNLMPEVLEMEYGIYPEYWENNNFGQAEVDELARQSYWIGASVDMIWAADGSSAYMTAVPTAFTSYWKASSSTRTSFTTPPAGGTDVSYNTIKAQLDASRPWVWAGGVHAFVLDGYRDDYWYHFNWGWGGSYDGWFHRSSLIPDGSGAGGGDGDYTAGQEGVTYVPSINPFTAWPATTVSGSIANGEDITISWTAKTGATGYKVYRTKDQEQNPTLMTTTTSLSYNDNDLPAGVYYYHVVVTYATGESHNSNNYALTAAIVSDYKYPTGLNGSAVGRTSIDLSWVKPYTGVPILTQGWEAGTLGTWTVRGSKIFTDATNTPWVVDDGSRWGVSSLADLGAGGEAYIHDGTYTNYVGYDAGGGFTNLTQLSWLISPQITLGTSDEWIFWVWYCNMSPAGAGYWATNMYFVFYTGNFTETNGVGIAANTTILDYWDGADLYLNAPNWGNNKFDSPVNFDLTPYAGLTGRLCIIYDYNDGYQAAVDDVIYGRKTGGSTEPLGYQVYRNGLPATTITGPTNTTWSDTGFADGVNSYFVRATYPSSNVSVPSLTKNIYINANPKPYYLSGTYDEVNTEVDLTWFQPYMNPTMWYCYYDVNTSTTTIDMMDTAAAKRRVEFESDAGYYYPVTIDSIGAYFYDWNEGNWGGSNTFRIRVVALGFYAAGGGMLPDTTLWESGTLTATHNQMYKVKLPTALVRTKGWAVEVEALNATTGDPGNLAGPSPDGNIHSYFYETTEESYSYYMVTQGQPAEYAILSHIASSQAPPIAKNGGWSGTQVELPVKLNKENRNNVQAVKIDSRRLARDIQNGDVEKDTKALSNYKIYRNGSYLGQSSILSYTDTNPIMGDNTYYVTANYTSPSGESEGSNEFIWKPDPVAAYPASITKTVPPGQNQQGTFELGNTGYGSLNYSMDFEYTDTMSQTQTPVDEHFASSLGTFTSSANWAYSTTAPVYETGHARIASSGSGVKNGYLTNTSNFDLSMCTSGTKLDFAYIHAATATTDYIRVETSTDGTNFTTLQTYSATTGGAWATASLDITNTVKKIRFYGSMAKGASKYLGVDVIKVYGQQQMIAPWFSWVSATEGIVAGVSSNTITCAYNATTLPNGTYNGQVTFTTDDPTTPTSVKPVVLTVQTGGAPPATPSLSAPANASNTYDPTPTFDWADVSGATSYTVQVDNNSSFASPEINQVVASSTYTPASLADGTYYWKVLATNAYGSSVYSSAWTVTKASLGTPTILSTSIVGSDLVIDWNDIAGADRYNVYYSTDPYSFTLYNTVMGNTNSTYTYTNVGTNGKMFFLIKAANALTKEAPKKIEIAKPATVK